MKQLTSSDLFACHFQLFDWVGMLKKIQKMNTQLFILFAVLTNYQPKLYLKLLSMISHNNTVPKIQSLKKTQAEAELGHYLPDAIEIRLEHQVKSLICEQSNYKQIMVIAAEKVIEIILKYAYELEKSATEQPFTQNLKCQPPKHTTEQYNTIIYPSRKTKWVRNISKEQQKEKYQQRKHIAFSFCDHGINFHFITQKYPKMEAKTYRCIVEAVNNETVNEIVEFLRYECNIQIERLNRDQKRSIRTQLTKIKDWLGNRDSQQLQTFYKFIYRHYDKQLQIKFEDALKLYKTIIQIIKSPFVNVLDAQEAVKEGNESERPMEQDKAMIILFIKHKDLNKVSDDLCQKYGYDVKWSIHSVQVRMRHFLQASFDKLVSTVKEDARSLYINFLNQKRRQMLQQKLEISARIEFYSYYLQKKTSSPKIKHLLLKLQDFFKFYQKDSSQVQLLKTEQSNITDLTQAEIVKSQISDQTKEYFMNQTQQCSLKQEWTDVDQMQKQQQQQLDQVKIEQ